MKGNKQEKNSASGYIPFKSGPLAVDSHYDLLMPAWSELLGEAPTPPTPGNKNWTIN